MLYLQIVILFLKQEQKTEHPSRERDSGGDGGAGQEERGPGATRGGGHQLRGRRQKVRRGRSEAHEET